MIRDRSVGLAYFEDPDRSRAVSLRTVVAPCAERYDVGACIASDPPMRVITQMPKIPTNGETHDDHDHNNGDNLNQDRVR